MSLKLWGTLDASSVGSMVNCRGLFITSLSVSINVCTWCCFDAALVGRAHPV